MDKKVAKKQFNTQKNDAKRRGIPFLLSFDEWCNLWEQSGVYHLRGKRKGCYCMSRIGDLGAYEINNVYINQFSTNVSDAQLGKSKPELSKMMIGRKHSQETKDKMSANHARAMAGKHHTDETKERISQSTKGKPKSAETRAKMAEAARNRPKRKP